MQVINNYETRAVPFKLKHQYLNIAMKT